MNKIKRVMFPVDSIERYSSDRIINFNKAAELILKMKTESKTVGLCHGCFDLLHPGHMTHFESAKKMCDILFVSLTADKFITERKGSGRPIYSDKLRAYLIANLRVVDYVVVADYATAVEVIEFLKPSLYIKGPDIKNLESPAINAERQKIKDVGGEIRYTDDPKLATTDLIFYIKQELDKN